MNFGSLFFSLSLCKQKELALSLHGICSISRGVFSHDWWRLRYAILSLSAFITLWMRIQREKWCVRDTFVRERRRRHHPKKNLKTCFNPITIETLKTKIVFFFRSLDTKKGTKVLILPSKIHTQCSDIYYYRFLTISSSNDDVLTIAFWFLRRVWLRGENTKSMA